MPNPMQPDEMVEPDGPKFKIFSGALKAFEKDVNGQQRKYLRCTASSSVEDLHGDVMTDDCVLDMAPQAKQKGMTIFLNHEYKWPEDIAGKTTDAMIFQRARDGEGKPIYDLDLEIEVNDSNERAVNSFTAIKDQGIKAGISIGAEIIDWEFRDEDQGWWGGLEIKKINLLEASIVGIPANPRSWVTSSLQALGAPKAIVRKSAGLPERTMKTETPPPVVEEEITEVTEEVTETTIDVEASAAPDQETPEEAEDTSAETVEEDTESTEKSAPDAETTVAELKAAGMDSSMLEIVLGFLEGATEEVTSLRNANKVLTDERDEAKRQAEEAVQFVEALAQTPLGRKAQFAGPVSTFRTRFGAIYEESFLKLLERENASNE